MTSIGKSIKSSKLKWEFVKWKVAWSEWFVKSKKVTDKLKEKIYEKKTGEELHLVEERLKKREEKLKAKQDEVKG